MSIWVDAQLSSTLAGWILKLSTNVYLFPYPYPLPLARLER